ncbi:hypothetical protein MNBD_BACTEROID01-2841 [hydrothermal vent metagenome]|uniref:Uncharacterized protein n=1 Tax=hydrothermal vent metagenome TaxID=652676 RepID=A0A3B0TUM0_9ZZZZ
MDDLKKIAPKLSSVKKGNPYRVPDNYFEDFYARLEPKLHSGGTDKKKRQTTLIRLLKPALGLAASITLIFLIVYWPLSRFDMPSVVQNNFGPVTNEKNEQYSILIDELDESSLFALLGNNLEDGNYSDDELIGYLSTSFDEYELFLESDKKMKNEK